MVHDPKSGDKCFVQRETKIRGGNEFTEAFTLTLQSRMMDLGLLQGYHSKQLNTIHIILESILLRQVSFGPRKSAVPYSLWFRLDNADVATTAVCFERISRTP